jgi:hypothetical protein
MAIKEKGEEVARSAAAPAAVADDDDDDDGEIVLVAAVADEEKERSQEETGTVEGRRSDFVEEKEIVIVQQDEADSDGDGEAEDNVDDNAERDAPVLLANGDTQESGQELSIIVRCAFLKKMFRVSRGRLLTAFQMKLNSGCCGERSNDDNDGERRSF